MGIVPIIGGYAEIYFKAHHEFFSTKFAIFSNHFSTPSQFVQHFTFLFHIQVYTHRRVIRRWGGGGDG